MHSSTMADHMYALSQDCGNSTALALELPHFINKIHKITKVRTEEWNIQHN